MRAFALLFFAVLISGVVWSVFEFAPFLLNSRIERLGERDLPKVVIEKGGIIYCRMKADDFCFPLPPGSRALRPIIKLGGFDTVDGTVEAQFDKSPHVTASEYEKSLSGRLKVGGRVTATPIPGGLLIKFYYFGDW